MPGTVAIASFIFSPVFATPHLYDRLYGHEAFDRVVAKEWLERLDLPTDLTFDAKAARSVALSTDQRKRLALARGDAEMLALADLWASRAAAVAHTPDAFAGSRPRPTPCGCEGEDRTVALRLASGQRGTNVGGAVGLVIQDLRSGLRTNNAKSPVKISMPMTNPKTGIQLPVAS